ncbi:hypothetical protein GCM10010232_11820 [Streptomyces amakusaensis]|uniref:Recombinase family protein n=1 Tax=Streptomyces amakusaensis TaxID=67271 RepID=A0ABW0AFY8_9ACTN
MIEWCLRHGKDLVSRHDTIDLSTIAGSVMTKAIGGVAEIEAAAMSTRVTSLWEYTRNQPDWLVGKPPYGYAIDDRGRLVISPQEQRVQRWCLRAALRGVSARRMTAVLIRANVPTGGGGRWTTSTLLRRLRNPALMGVRVEECRNGGVRRSRTVLGADSDPIEVAAPILTEPEWLALQAALDKRAKAQPTRRQGVRPSSWGFRARWERAEGSLSPGPGGTPGADCSGGCQGAPGHQGGRFRGRAP